MQGHAQPKQTWPLGKGGSRRLKTAPLLAGSANHGRVATCTLFVELGLAVVNVCTYVMTSGTAHAQQQQHHKAATNEALGHMYRVASPFGGTCPHAVKTVRKQQKWAVLLSWPVDSKKAPAGPHQHGACWECRSFCRKGTEKTGSWRSCCKEQECGCHKPAGQQGNKAAAAANSLPYFTAWTEPRHDSPPQCIAQGTHTYHHDYARH